MASNRFYTVLIVPEKTSQVRRFVIPSWLFRSAAIGGAILALTATVMFVDYWYVMNQVGENKELRLENRRLRQQVQVFQNKMDTIESTMERVKTFATRLKVITNIEDRNGLLQSLNQKSLPNAATNIGSTVVKTSAPAPGQANASATATPTAATVATGTGSLLAMNTLKASSIPGMPPTEDPADIILRRDYDQLDMRFQQLNTDSLSIEETLQDEYELLADQKSFLAALPTIQPAIGYFTSGFGVRKNPVDGIVRMHEGLDIANRPGTPIRAPADGSIEFAGPKSGYGNVVMINHGYGLETIYGHTRKILVHIGQHVTRGQTIALMGSTGRSTGPHVHYEVRVHGTPVDPLSFILGY